MKNFKSLFLILALSMMPGSLFSTESISSPSGRIQVNCNICINPDPYPSEVRLYYNIFYRGERLIADSEIGILLDEDDSIGIDLRLYDIRTLSGREDFTAVHGRQKVVSIEYNEMVLRLQEREFPFRLMDLIFRVSDEGAAYRIHFPEQPGLEKVRIREEKSSFNPANTQSTDAWPLILPSYSSHYEANYQPMKVRDIPENAIIGLPLLMRSPRNVWFAISESGLSGYAGLYLTPSKMKAGFLESRLSPALEGEFPVIGNSPLSTPWRVILIGDRPGALIESNWILALNEPSRIMNTGWIQSGKCVWPWWSGRHVENTGFQGGMNTETMLHYLEFAAENNIEYLLIDAGWYGAHNNRYENITTPIPEVDLGLILEKAKQSHVGIILWLFWECVQDQMETAFPVYENWGISGVKIDYMNRDDQAMVGFYHDVLERAAEHHLLVDFHGAYKPTGIRRTWPNLITREGVLGLEWSKWSKHCDPDHELTIPFTRMLAGPMDFTPGAFRTDRQDRFDPRSNPPVAMGTVCHQLAMYVVYESPLQMMVDYPNSYRKKPGLSFLRSVPATWDSTVVIDGSVGDYIIIARRSGQEWFLGAMTDWTPRQIDISLSFLSDTRYTAEIYQDGSGILIDPSSLLEFQVEVDSTRSLIAPMGPGGGFAVRFAPLANLQPNTN
jgi:alpha-glucosidase